jgi:hypothetical protein
VSDRRGWAGCETYDRDKSTGDGEKDLARGIVRVEDDAGRGKCGILVWWNGGRVVGDGVGGVLTEGRRFYWDVVANAGEVVVVGGIHEGENERTES